MLTNCCCCAGPTVILIYNSNAVADHDFDVTLNGTFLANRQGATPPLCKATIFRPTEVPPIDTWTVFPLGCFPITYEYFSLNPTLWIDGNNTLILQTTNTNLIDNFGILQVVRLKLNDAATGWVACKTFLNTTYSSGFAPVTLTYTFTWSPP